jgi:outer membrane receptor for ferrienterochelin and colicins
MYDNQGKSIFAVFILFFLLGNAEVFAQGTVHIYVADSTVTGPMSDAIIRVSPISKLSKAKGNVNLTDRNGVYSFSYTEPVIVQVSYLGYQSITDTISAPHDRAYDLKRSIANIDDIVVTGQYAAGSASQSIYQMEVYTQKDIREKGATNLRELLQNSLDVDLSHDPVFGSGVSLQGVSGEGVKMLLDGVPLVGRSSGILDISQIDLTNIERVEVIKGPMSTIYGSDATGGVMNLISKTNPQEKFHIDLKGYYESVGQYNASLSGGVNLGKSQLSLSGGRNFFGGYSAVDTSRHKDWAPKEQYFANAKYVYNTSKFRIGTSLSFLREIIIDRGDLMPNTEYAFDTHYLTYRAVGSVFATVPIDDHSKLDMLMAYSGYYQFINFYQKNLVTLSENIEQDAAPDTSVYHDIIARAVYTYTAKKILSLQTGIDIDQEYTHQSLISGDDQAMGDYAIFGSLSIKPLAGLNIMPALRLAYNTKFNLPLLDITVNKAKIDVPLIPSLNIKYDFAQYFTLRASYGLGYRTPSLQELYLSFHDSNHNLDGNPNLKPETSNAGNLEFDFHIRRNGHSFTLSNTGFINQVNNKIDYILTDASSTPVSYQYFNINSYMTIGGEHIARYDWQRLMLSAGVNYIRYQVDLGQAGVGPQHLFSPDATFKAGYKIPKAEIGIMVAYKYTGKKLLYSLVNGNSNEQGYLYSYNTLDVSLTRNFWKDRILLTCGAKNILNVTNVATSGAVPFGHGDTDTEEINWGRTYFVSLNLHFAK